MTAKDIWAEFDNIVPARGCQIPLCIEHPNVRIPQIKQFIQDNFIPKEDIRRAIETYKKSGAQTDLDEYKEKAYNQALSDLIHTLGI